MGITAGFLPHPTGAATLSKVEEQCPEEGPANLELLAVSPGRLGERGSLTPEPGQLQKRQGRPPKQEVSQALAAVGDVSAAGRRQEFGGVGRLEDALVPEAASPLSQA